MFFFAWGHFVMNRPLGFCVFFVFGVFFAISGVWIFEFCSLCSLCSLFLSFSLSPSIFITLCLACICSPPVSKGEGASSADLGGLSGSGSLYLPTLPPPPRGLSTQGPEHPWHLCRCRHGCTNQPTETRQNNAALRFKGAMESR